MPILKWDCAHGEAKPVQLESASTVHLAAWDDSVDTNIVHITRGEVWAIEWFGWGQGHACTKRVLFDGGLLLRHSRHLQLLGLQDREIIEPAIGVYATEGDGFWNEISFTATGAAETVRRLNGIDRRLDALYLRLEEIESRLHEIERARRHARALS